MLYVTFMSACCRIRETLLCYRTLRERILEQDAQIEDLSAAASEAASSAEDSGSAGELRRKLQEATDKAAAATDKAATAEAELAKVQATAEEKDTASAAVRQRNTALQDELKRKDEDMRVMEEKYKRYLEKARSVSSAAEVGGGDVGLAQDSQLKNAVITLQQQLQDKDVELQKLRAMQGTSVGLQVGDRQREVEHKAIKEEVRLVKTPSHVVHINKTPMSETKSVQVGNEQMAEHVLKAKIEGLQAEVREYRNEIKEVHDKYIDGLLIRSPVQVQNSERFQSPAKHDATPTKAFTEKFKVFEQRCKSYNADDSLVLSTSKDRDSSVVKKRPQRGTSVDVNKRLSFGKESIEVENQDKQEIASLRGRVQTLEQELFIATQQYRVLESDLINRDHEIRAMASQHKQQMDRALYFSNPGQTDSEKENQLLRQHITSLEQQLNDVSSEGDKDLRIQQLENELHQVVADLQRANEYSQELQVALEKAREAVENKELHYRRILEKLRHDMRKANNPTVQMFGWFLKRDSW